MQLFKTRRPRRSLSSTSLGLSLGLMATGGVGCSPSTPSVDEKKTASAAEAEAEAEAAREKLMKQAAEARAAAADKAWDGWTHTSRLAGLSAPPAVPDSNPMGKEKIALGHRLFMDKRLSKDGSRSCYSCHLNEYGNTDGQAKALGAGDKPLTRNSPTIWNVAYHSELYWDGRAKSLEAQALGAWRGGNAAGLRLSESEATSAASHAAALGTIEEA